MHSQKQKWMQPAPKIIFNFFNSCNSLRTGKKNCVHYMHMLKGLDRLLAPEPHLSLSVFLEGVCVCVCPSAFWLYKKINSLLPPSLVAHTRSCTNHSCACWYCSPASSNAVHFRWQGEKQKNPVPPSRQDVHRTEINFFFKLIF